MIIQIIINKTHKYTGYIQAKLWDYIIWVYSTPWFIKYSVHNNQKLKFIFRKIKPSCKSVKLCMIQSQSINASMILRDIMQWNHYIIIRGVIWKVQKRYCSLKIFSLNPLYRFALEYVHICCISFSTLIHLIGHKKWRAWWLWCCLTYLICHLSQDCL